MDALQVTVNVHMGALNHMSFACMQVRFAPVRFTLEESEGSAKDIRAMHLPSSNEVRIAVLLQSSENNEISI